MVVALSREVRARARAFLRPGEEIRYLIPVVAASAPYDGITFLVVVTDESVTVLSVGLFSRSKPKGVWGRYPRNTRIGPVSTGTPPRFALGGLTFEIEDEYVAEVNAADAEGSAGDILPPDPLPDL